jgi:hypothetical protein
MRGCALDLLNKMTIGLQNAPIICCAIGSEDLFAQYVPAPGETLAYWTIWEHVIYGLMREPTRFLKGMVSRGRSNLSARMGDLVTGLAQLRDRDDYEAKDAVVRILAAVLAFEDGQFIPQVLAHFPVEEIVERMTELLANEDIDRFMKMSQGLIRLARLGETREIVMNVLNRAEIRRLLLQWRDSWEVEGQRAAVDQLLGMFPEEV